MLRSIFIFIVALSSMAEASSLLMGGARNARRLPSFRAQLRKATRGAQMSSANFQVTVDVNAKLRLGRHANQQTLRIGGTFAEFKMADSALRSSPLLKALAADPFLGRALKRKENKKVLIEGETSNSRRMGKNAAFKRAARDAAILNACPDLGTLLQAHAISYPAEKKILAIIAQYKRELGGNTDCLTSSRLEIKQFWAQGLNMIKIVTDLIALLNEEAPGIAVVETRPSAPEACKVHTYCSIQARGSTLKLKERERDYSEVHSLVQEEGDLKGAHITLETTDPQTNNYNGRIRRREAKIVLKETSQKYGTDTVKPSVLASCPRRGPDHFAQEVTPCYSGMRKDERRLADIHCWAVREIQKVLKEDKCPRGISHSVTATRCSRSVHIADLKDADKIYKKLILPRLMKERAEAETR